MSRALDIFKNALWELAEEQPRRYPAPSMPENPVNSFVAFRYSRTEISAQGMQASVKRSETRLENGRFITEECEATVDRQAYEQAAEQAQRYFIDQMNQVMKMFFLPFSSRRRFDE